MSKRDEELYFEKIGKDGVDFTLSKPFSDNENVGTLLSDIATIFSFLPKDRSKIIDLGCGSGWTSSFYAKAGHDVTGVDISKKAIESASEYFKQPNLKFICSDFDSMEYDNEFDVAIFNDSLHHTDSEEKTIQSVYKMLKPGGVIIICEPGVGHSKSESSIRVIKDYGVSERDMPPKLSKKSLKKAGFCDIKTYAHPGKLHRINYKKFQGKKSVLNNMISRGLLSMAYSSVFKNNHGIVVAKK